MSKKKKQEEEEESTKLDENLLNEFSQQMEEAINEVCKKHSDLDPRLELLVTLGLFAAQVSVDSGFSKDDFLNTMAEMYDDFESDEDENIDMSTVN